MEINPVLSQRINDAHRAAAEAESVAKKALAEAYRQFFVALAEQFPIDYITWDVEYEYDDEGGYYPYANIYARLESDAAFDLEDEVQEIIADESFDVLALSYLSDEGEVNIEQLRSTSF